MEGPRRLVELLHGVVGEEADVVGCARENPQLHRLQQRPVVGALDARELRNGSVDGGGEAGEGGVAPLRTERRPGRKGSPCRGDGGVDLRRTPGGHPGQLPAVPVDRASYGETVGAGDAAAVDEVIQRDDTPSTRVRLGLTRFSAPVRPVPVRGRSSPPRR